jgi:hypothetical protein
MGGACCTHGRGEKSVQVLVEKPEGKRPVLRKMGTEWILGRLAGGVLESVQLAQDRDW